MMKNGTPTDPTSYGAGRYADSKDPIRDWVADEQTAGRARKTPAVLAAERAETDVSTRAMRLRAACEALEAVGIAPITPGSSLARAKEKVTAIRRSLLNGSDPARLTACNVALEALGRLWACS